MKLIVGLGNPGRDYDRTRHNAGFMVVDRLARRFAPGAMVRSKFSSGIIEANVSQSKAGGQSERCLLMQPTTYMNRSGQAVGEAIRFYKLSPADDLLVITDDFALPVGAIRLRASGGDGGHNGLSDIRQKLGTDVYTRLRVGIGAKPSMMNQADYVLSRFHAEEADALEDSLSKAADAAACWACEGADAAMNRFNVRVKAPRREAPKREGAKADQSGPQQSGASPANPAGDVQPASGGASGDASGGE